MKTINEAMKRLQKSKLIKESSEFYTNDAEYIYEKIQNEYSDEQRKELYKKINGKEPETMDEFWDWFKSLDSDEIESLEESCNKSLNEDYTAREAFDASMKRYLANGEGRTEDDIKVLVETDNYILTGTTDEEKPDRIYLDVTTGSYRTVEVFIDQDYRGKVESAKVNWSAIGSVGVKEAEEFVNHINDALEFIKQIDGKDFSSEFNK